MDIADEAQPEYVYQLFFRSNLVRYRVDYVAKRATLDAVWGYEFSLDHRGDMARYGGGIKPNALYQGCRSGGYVRHCQGKTFLFINGGPHVFRVDGYQLIPCTTIGSLLNVHRPECNALARITPTGRAGPHGPLSVDAGTRRIRRWRDNNADWEVHGETKSIGHCPLARGRISRGPTARCTVTSIGT